YQAPHRSQRPAGDLTAVGALGCAVYQQRLQQLKEIARRISDTVVALPGIAELRAQERYQLVCVRDVITQEVQAFQFAQQATAHLRHQLLQVLFQMLTSL